MRAIIHQTFTLAPAKGSYSIKAKTAKDASKAAAERCAHRDLDEVVVAVYCAARDTFEVHDLWRFLGVWRVMGVRQMTEHERDHGVKAWDVSDD